MEKQGLILTYLKEISTKELDFLLRDKILGKNWDEGKEYPYFYHKNEKSWSRESSPVSIDYVIDILEKLKKKGANYVEIMYHGDHIEYVFNGLEIHKMNQKELEEYENNIKLINNNIRNKEIAKLEEELQRLKNDKEI